MPLKAVTLGYFRKDIIATAMTGGSDGIMMTATESTWIKLMFMSFGRSRQAKISSYIS